MPSQYDTDAVSAALVLPDGSEPPAFPFDVPMIAIADADRGALYLTLSDAVQLGHRISELLSEWVAMGPAYPACRP